VIGNSNVKSGPVPELKDTRPLEVATYDVLLPCRRFEVSYKLAVVGRVSLTTEFLLRLLKATDGLDECKAATFFGFDHRDMAFVVAEAQVLGYIDRDDGFLRLTSAGTDLFRGGSDTPEIYEIEQRREPFVFDLLSLAPQRPEQLDEHELYFPELKGADPSQISSASRTIPEAVRKFYFELVGSKDRNGSSAAKRSIYSIDDVRAGNRLSALVSISVRLNASSPGTVEPDLSSWRSDQELDDRAKIVNSVSQFVEGLKVHKAGSEADAYRMLIDVAPEFLKDFTRSDGLAVDRYLREASTRVGEVRSDRPTVPLVGNLTTLANVERLSQIIRYARRRQTKPATILWLKPNVKSWGMTVQTMKVLDRLTKMIGSIEGDQSSISGMSVCLSVGEPEYLLQKIFSENVTSSGFPFPQALEVLLVPGLLTAMLVHSPVGSYGFPIPLGFASFDGQVIERVHDLMRERVSNYIMKDGLQDTIFADLNAEVSAFENDGVPADDHH
jgi:hypothetical protein